MTLSIAMATYNGAQYLREQLDSLAAQTLLPDELVVTDDGSDDGTIAILEAFAADAPFAVHIHRNPDRLGFAKNFDRALTLCRGDILFLCDQDDRWDRTKLAVVAETFERNPRVMTVLNDARLVDEQMNWFGLTQLGVIRSSGVGDHAFVTGCCSAHRRRFLQMVLPIGEKVEHDLWINRAAHAAGVSLILSEPLQDFRRHGSNSSNWPLSAARQGKGSSVASHWSAVDRLPRASWRYSRDILDAIAARLEGKRDINPDERRWLEGIRHERDSFAARLELIDRNRIKRLPLIATMLRHKQYSAFTGWKSAVKDLIRP